MCPVSLGKSRTQGVYDQLDCPKGRALRHRARGVRIRIGQARSVWLNHENISGLPRYAMESRGSAPTHRLLAFWHSSTQCRTSS
jgi:hypothetical protein